MRAPISGSRSSPACRVWYVPPDAKADAALDEAWRRLAGAEPGEPQDLIVKGHAVHVPKAAMGVARFSFADLCSKPLAASDYLRIAHEFHTVILDHIPVLDYGRRNEAKRFIILIDTLYDHCVKLLASAEAEPDQLYLADEGYEAQGVQAHGVAPDRNALAILSRPAAWPAAGHGDRRRENCRDLKKLDQTSRTTATAISAAASQPENHQPARQFKPVSRLLDTTTWSRS